MHSRDLSSAELAVNVAGVATHEILANYQNPSLTCLVIGLRDRDRDWMDGSTAGGGWMVVVVMILNFLLGYYVASEVQGIYK